MKKITLMVVAALVAVVSFAQVPALKHVQNLQLATSAARAQLEVAKMQNLAASQSRLKAPKKAAEDYPIITAKPEGELKTYQRAGMAYSYSSSTGLVQRAQSGTVDIVFAEGNEVYILDPVSTYAAGAWVKGSLSEDGTTITVPLFQHLKYFENYDATLMIAVGKTEGDNTVVDESVTEVTYTIAEDGVISLNGTTDETPLGAFWSDDFSWQGYGDYESVYTPYTPNFDVVTLPEDLETAEYPLTGDYYAGLNAYQYNLGEAVSATVKVAKDGNTYYFQGLVQLLPEAWVKGEFDEAEGEVVIPVTYLGENGEDHAYVMGYSSSGPAPVYLVYDAESNTFELDGYLMVSSKEQSNTMDAIYTGLFLGELPELVVVPETAEVTTLPLSATYYDGQNSSELSATVNVAIDGEDVYIQGLIQEVPEGWIKGAFNEDHTQIIFPYGQYVGRGDYGSVYAVGDVEVEDEEGNATTEIADIIFDYDAAKEVYTDANLIYANAKKDQIYYYSLLANTMIGYSSDEVWVAADQGYDNAEEVTEIQIGETVTGTLSQASGTNAPKYYTSGTALRLYAGNTLTITAEQTIAKIVFTMTGSAKQMSLETEQGAYEFDSSNNTGTWTGEAKEVTFSVPSASGSQARIQKIQIFYFDYSTVAVEAPEDLEVETYKLTGHDSYDDEETSYEVKVGFDDDYVYIQGLSYYVPEAWVRGTISEDGTVDIPGWYLGVYESFYGDFDIVFSGATFVYDGENNLFYSEEGFQTYANDQYTMDELDSVVISQIVEIEATPADPSITAFNGGSSYPNVRYNIPTVDVDGNDLVGDKLSFVIWIEKDGVEQQLTLTPEFYTEIDEDITEIPYNFSDNYDIFNNGLYLNQGIDELKSWTKIGIQSIYRGAGVEHTSNIGWFDLVEYWQELEIATGINSVAAEAGAARYFDLQGRQVSAAQKGLLIMQVRQADGSVKNVKVLRK